MRSLKLSSYGWAASILKSNDRLLRATSEPEQANNIIPVQWRQTTVLACGDLIHKRKPDRTFLTHPNHYNWGRRESVTSAVTRKLSSFSRLLTKESRFTCKSSMPVMRCSTLRRSHTQTKPRSIQTCMFVTFSSPPKCPQEPVHLVILCALQPRISRDF